MVVQVTTPNLTTAVEGHENFESCLFHTTLLLLPCPDNDREDR